MGGFHQQQAPKEIPIFQHAMIFVKGAPKRGPQFIETAKESPMIRSTEKTCPVSNQNEPDNPLKEP